ncbi:MAG TPA: hypothetical protein VG406_01075 [Isosphaeraceae bacterium]|jgi:hypothetical protein|nr:hypothetical protein [Isosphaeraceae bacterium]
MRDRTTEKYQPDLERLEPKLPLSAGAATMPIVGQRAGHLHPADRAGLAGAAGGFAVPGQHGGRSAAAGGSVSIAAVKPHFGYLVYRITNPNIHNNTLIPPFGHVLVQRVQPIPGQTYNVLSLVVRNGTNQTFDASSGFAVKVPGDTYWTPILTGNEQWMPGQHFVFYILTKKYYPLRNQVTSGFIFNMGGAISTAIPGPSGIFLRLKYNPATFGRSLDAIVAFGQGAQGGSGIRTGIADTQIYEFVSALTNRNDFGGYF